jgi:hypothetical protein
VTLVTAGFVALPLLVAAGFVLACDAADRRLGERADVRRRRTLSIGAAVLAWLLLTTLAAASGVLRRFDVFPPPFAGVPLAVTALGLAVACSPLGTRLVRGLPLWVLVGSQAFRFPLELLMHEAHVAGVMPVQMSYSGQNYDIVTGLSAGVLGWWLARGRVPGWVVLAWNVLGFGLLLNVVTVAIVSTPIFGWFGPDRLVTFVTYPPFVWLPTVLVPAALIGHILVWRKLIDLHGGPEMAPKPPDARSAPGNPGRSALALVSAAALVLGGCALMDAPDPRRGHAAPADSPSPSASPSDGFGSPQGLFERYPTMRNQKY